MLRRSGRIALVVGTLLALINHGDSLLRAELTPLIGAKLALTDLVPFAVAAWSALLNSRIRSRP
jgi:hypothetical protein